MQTDATHLTYAAAIRRLGRNPRPQATGVLEPEAAAALWSALLARRFSAAQEAALLMGLRVHGESAALLAALARATPVAAIAAPAGTVVISCSGAARKHPSAAPLLALHLVQQGIPVLILTATPGGRGNAAAVLTALGHTAATSTTAAAQAITSTGLAWTALTTIAPALARVIALRAELGFRNSAHTVLKLIDPIDPIDPIDSINPIDANASAGMSGGLIATSYTHAAYRATLATAIADLGRSAWLARGTEGDPIAWEGESHPPLAWMRGTPFDLDAMAPTSPAAAVTGLIAGDDAATADWTRRALAGETAIPPAIERQAQTLATLSKRLAP
ncbi:MAG: hypothetical protein RRY41_07565 [Burkholderiaceae bacterium]